MDINQDLGLRRDSRFDTVTLYITTALFGITIVLTIVQVFARQLSLQSYGPVFLTEPLARFTLIVATFLGAAVAARNNENIRMTLVTDRAETYDERVATGLQLLSSVIVIGFVALAGIATAMATPANWSTSIGGVQIVSEGYLYLGITIGLLVFLVSELNKFRGKLKQLTGSAPQSERETSQSERETGQSEVDSASQSETEEA